MLAGNAADIGNIVRQRRLESGLTQAALAERIGVSRKWVADLERGHPRAELHLVLDVLSALDALVDIVDAPREQTGRGSDFEGMARGLSQMPVVAIQSGLAKAVAQIAEDMKFAPQIAQSLSAVQGLPVISPDQLASIRNALAHVQIDEDTRRQIRSASKALTREEAKARERAQTVDRVEEP